MRSQLTEILETLQGVHKDIAAGLIDRHGLVVEALGEHGDCPLEELAAHLVAVHGYAAVTLDRQIGGGWRRQLLRSESQILLVHTLASGHVLYALAPIAVAEARLFEAAAVAVAELERLLAGWNLLSSGGRAAKQVHQLGYEARAGKVD